MAKYNDKLLKFMAEKDKLIEVIYTTNTFKSKKGCCISEGYYKFLTCQRDIINIEVNNQKDNCLRV